ncbi:MAG: PAS domain S-box protein [Deltaproteobacteria bacterium]|nr:PAS domain S-box protein [Deltaproteobacteria bacterium]
MVGGGVEGGDAASGLQAKLEKLERRLVDLSGIEEKCRRLEKERDEAQRLLWQMMGTTSEALENIGEHSELLRGIVSSLHDTIIFGLDRAGRYLFCWMDPALEEMYGMRASDLKGKSLLDIFPPGEAEHRIAETKRTFDTGQRHHEEYRLNLPSGEVWHDATLAPMRNSSGAVTAVIAIVHDVTTHKLAEEERYRLLVKLRRAEKLESLGIIAGGIAHDFNSLMMGVMGNTELLLEELPADSLLRPRFLSIENAVQQAYDLVQHLLTCVGKRTFDLRRHDLVELAQRSIELVRSSVPDNVSLTLESAPELPTAFVDATQIVQILTNLLVNASEAIGEGGGTIEVHVGTVRADMAFLTSTYLNEELSPGEYLSLKVKDSGCGMSEQQLSRLFEPFFTTKSQGRGLGLASLPGILRGHSGDARITSYEGQGTTIQLLLPVGRGKNTR